MHDDKRRLISLAERQMEVGRQRSAIEEELARLRRELEWLTPVAGAAPGPEHDEARQRAEHALRALEAALEHQQRLSDEEEALLVEKAALLHAGGFLG